MLRSLIWYGCNTGRSRLAGTPTGYDTWETAALRRSSLEIRKHARHITQYVDYLPYGNRSFPEDRNFASAAIDDSAEGGSYEPGIEKYDHMVSKICHIICSVNN